MTQPPLQLVHMFPYCHKISGGHSNAIRAMVLAEISQGVDSLMFCPFCDDPALDKLRRGTVVVRRHGPAGDSSDEQVSQVSLGAPNQIFHLHGVNLDIVRFARCLRQKAAPYVLTSHGSLNYRHPLHFLKKFIVLNFLSTLVRKAKGVRFLTARECRRFRWLMPGWRGPTLVAPHAVQVPDPSQVVAAPRTDFGIPPDDFLFLYLGRLDFHTKGLDMLLQAFSRVAAGCAVRLALVGPDWQGGQARLTCLARQLGCDNRVHFLGPQYGAKKWAVLKMADAFVSPSRWDAGPIAVKEAIGFGVPTITSTAINPAEELAEHQAAYLCSPSPRAVAHAMSTLMGDATLRQQLRVNGQTWVRDHCSPSVVGQALVGFYERALAGDH